MKNFKNNHLIVVGKNILFEFIQKENCLANARQFNPINKY